MLPLIYSSFKLNTMYLANNHRPFPKCQLTQLIERRTIVFIYKKDNKHAHRVVAGT